MSEAREAGIEHFIFVTGRNKSVIEDHFDKQYELEQTLRERGKTTELRLLEADLPAAGQTSFTRQQLPLGLGHAVWCARELVGGEPFALLLPDMLVHGQPGCLKQMMDQYAVTGGNIVAVEEVPHDDTGQYGIVGVGETTGRAFTITSMIEKPPPGKAPSNLMIMGRYLLQPEIFDHIGRQNPGAGGEIQITDAMIALHAEQPFYGLEFEGETYDCGNKIGFLSANVAFALDRADIRDGFIAALDKVLAKYD